jgi:hypothetical protein
MLDAYIIDRIRRERERVRRERVRPRQQIPLPEPPRLPEPEVREDRGSGRGVTIIDFRL